MISAGRTTMPPFGIRPMGAATWTVTSPSAFVGSVSTTSVSAYTTSSENGMAALIAQASAIEAITALKRLHTGSSYICSGSANKPPDKPFESWDIFEDRSTDWPPKPAALDETLPNEDPVGDAIDIDKMTQIFVRMTEDLKGYVAKGDNEDAARLFEQQSIFINDLLGKFTQKMAAAKLKDDRRTQAMLLFSKIDIFNRLVEIAETQFKEYRKMIASNDATLTGGPIGEKASPYLLHAAAAGNLHMDITENAALMNLDIDELDYALTLYQKLETDLPIMIELNENLGSKTAVAWLLSHGAKVIWNMSTLYGIMGDYETYRKKVFDAVRLAGKAIPANILGGTTHIAGAVVTFRKEFCHSVMTRILSVYGPGSAITVGDELLTIMDGEIERSLDPISKLSVELGPDLTRLFKGFAYDAAANIALNRAQIMLEANRAEDALASLPDAITRFELAAEMIKPIGAYQLFYANTKRFLGKLWILSADIHQKRYAPEKAIECLLSAFDLHEAAEKIVKEIADRNEAVKDILKEFTNDTAMTAELLGLRYQKAGRVSEAAAAYNKALTKYELAGNTENAATVREKLGKLL